MAIETAPAFQFYVKEWRSSRPVMRMTFAQRGMYLEMLLEQWENLSLPDSPDECAELIGGTVEEWRANWDVLRRKFLTDESTGRIKNTRLEKCRKDRRRYDAWSKKNARKGGLARASDAKRGKDGTYHPAETPAESPADNAKTASRESSPENQPSPATPTASPTAPAVCTPTRGGGLIQKRRAYAAFEWSHGIYVPQQVHNDFLEMHGREFDGALTKWYERICQEWAGKRSTGTDMIKFWKARHDEQWPADAGKPKADTGPRYISADEHPTYGHGKVSA